MNDPLLPLFREVVQAQAERVACNLQDWRRYPEADFPLAPDRFAEFQEDYIAAFIDAFKLTAWANRPSVGSDMEEGQYRVQLLERITHHGVEMDVLVIEILDTGDRLPAVRCRPSHAGPAPGVLVNSGHGPHGLRDLVLDLDSYQAGMATRLAQAGFVTIAVEKIDSGYLSLDGESGDDETSTAAAGILLGQYTRGRQLKACLAAVDMLLHDDGVDPERVGACGVSLGGWLSVSTALLTPQLKKIADFGRKTLHYPSPIEAKTLAGMGDACALVPGLLAYGDRNLAQLACCPRRVLAGHGRRDKGSHEQHVAHFKTLCERQYAALGMADRYEYHIHDGGDDMPPDAVIDFFLRPQW